jgi:hypothetical protein
VNAAELDPGLNGPVGLRVGHQRPKAQGTNEFPARRWDVSAVQGGTGLHRGDEGRGVAVLDPGLAQTGMCAAGKGLGMVPVAACHRRQRPFTQRDRENIRSTAFFFLAEGIGEERIATVEVTAQDPCSPLQERSHSRYEVRGRELLRGLVGVGAHLLRPAAAREGPQGGGHRLGVRVKGRARVPVLPAVDRVFPPLGLGRTPRFPGQERGVHDVQRVSLDLAPV